MSLVNDELNNESPILRLKYKFECLFRAPHEKYYTSKCDEKLNM